MGFRVQERSVERRPAHAAAALRPISKPMRFRNFFLAGLRLISFYRRFITNIRKKQRKKIPVSAVFSVVWFDP